MMKWIYGLAKLLTALMLSNVCGHAQERALNNLELSLLGTHAFGVQFIWDGYGTAEIIDREGEMFLSGEQYSKDGEEYLKMSGTITVVDSRSFIFTGHLVLFTKGCCGLLDRQVSYTFRKTGTRKYWRLKERDALCSPYTCAYYLDIFE